MMRVSLARRGRGGGPGRRPHSFYLLRHQQRIAVTRSALKVEHQQNAGYHNSFSARGPRVETEFSCVNSGPREERLIAGFGGFLGAVATEATLPVAPDTERCLPLTSCKWEINNSGVIE